MKRTAIILAALMLGATLCACGGDSEKKTDSSAASKTESSTGSTSSKAESSDSGKSSKTESAKHTIQEYVDQVKKGGIEENDTMEIDVLAEDNTFVYSFTYKNQIEEDTLQGVKESLENSLETSSETYLGVVDEICDYTGLDADVKVVYKNKDGSVIAERTYNK